MRFLVSHSKASLEIMMADGCDACAQAGCEVCSDKTHWSRTAWEVIVCESAANHSDGNAFLGLYRLGLAIGPGAVAVPSDFARTRLRPCSASGSPCYATTASLCHSASPRTKPALSPSSATWLSGCWHLSKQQQDAFSSWDVRLRGRWLASSAIRRMPFQSSGRQGIGEDTCGSREREREK